MFITIDTHMERLLYVDLHVQVTTKYIVYKLRFNNKANWQLCV